MVLTREQAQKFYNGFGKKQDAQAFYEDAALDELVTHGEFKNAKSVAEFGCGTGRFADRLLTSELSQTSTYFGVDLSQTMVNLATERVSSYADRATIIQSNGSMSFPLADQSVNRFVSCYVLDLLSEEDARCLIAEAYRVLTSDGKLCLIGLTPGVTFLSQIVSRLWNLLFHLHAPWVGGCRPIKLVPLLDRQLWSIDYRTVVIQWGVPSEVLVASVNKKF